MPCRQMVDPDSVPSATHRLLCRDCRGATEADAMVRLTVDCMRAQPAPVEPLERILRTLALDGLTPVRITERRVLALQRRAARAARLLAIASVALLIWLWWIDLDPHVTVPTPAQPSPNAYTYFRAAGMGIVREREVGEAYTSTYPNPGSRAATAAPLGNGEKRALTDEQLVSLNATALMTLRLGLAYEYRDPPVRSFNQALPHFASYRALARLLALEASVRVRRGDTQGAVQSALDAMELGVMCPRGSGYIGRMVGVACETIGRRALEELKDKLDEPTARAAARRLEQMELKRTPLPSSMSEEMWASVAGLQEIMSKPGWRWSIASFLTVGEDRADTLARVAAGVASLPFSKRAIIGRYMRLAQAQMVRCAAPYPIRGSVAEPADGDRILGWMLPSYGNAAVKSDTNEALTRMMLVELGLRAYRAAHHGLPEELPRLVGAGILRDLPRDPFAPNATIRYLRRNGKPVLYCVGPDARDDHGLPAVRTTPSANANDRFVVDSGSAGDVVAGVSR